MTTRSLSAANTGAYFNGSSFNDSSLRIADLTLLYYENPTGKVSALCQVSYYADPGLGNYNITQEWIDISSQESKSLPDVFRNAPTSAADKTSKTLDESFISNTLTLSAPFTCQTNAYQIEAYFYSTNASNVEFQSNYYSTGPSGPGNFSSSMHSYSCAS